MQRLKFKTSKLLPICSLLFLAFVSVGSYAGTAANRGHTEQNSGGGISLFNSVESVPVLNVPLPNANTNYYYNTESIDKKSLSQPIVTIDKIVAYVNKGIITSVQLNQKVNDAIANFKNKGIPAPSIADIRNGVLDQLILQKIQLDLAKRSGITTNDIEITDAINSLAKQNNMSLDAFKASLSKQGINYSEFRKQIENQIIIDKLKQREVDARVSVNDDEINRVLNSQAFKNRVDYNLSDIIVSIPEQATADVVQQKQMIAQKAYDELLAGASFYTVAAKYSNAPNALNGGELGWRTNAVLPPQILNNIANLQPGQVTNIIHLPVGFIIFKVNAVKKQGSEQIVKQYHVRHILIKVNETTSDAEAHHRILQIKSILDKDVSDPKKLNQDFINLAKQYSQDTSSINGGDIGWVSKGDTVPAFEQVMVNSPIGVVSQPIRSPFGWHLLEVLGIRDSNLTTDKEKEEIRQEIRENKINFLYTQWLRDIRDSAYVKINNN
jgi:peptidyl-prolyl cis-trans isomerase SurA